MKKKLLHLSHNDIKTDARTLKQIKSAHEAGYDVHGIGIRLNKGLKQSGFVKFGKIESLDLLSKRITFLPAFLVHVLIAIELWPRMFLRAMKSKPDLIHCSDTLVLPVGVMVKLFTRAKLVYDAHELESDRKGISKPVAWITLVLEKLLWRFVDSLIVVSPSIGEWYCKNIGAKRSAVILNSPTIHSVESVGHDYLRQRFSIAPREKIFLYIGILGRGRGIELLLEVFSQNEIKSSVVFLGYGLLENEVKARAEKCSNVFFHEGVEHERVVEIAQSADVGLCLIENVSLSDYYSLPNKLFEYIFAGKPVLASRFPDISRLVEEYRLGALSNLNVEDIRSAVMRIESGDVDIDFQVSDLEGISWNAQSDKLLTLYSETLNAS